VDKNPPSLNEGGIKRITKTRPPPANPLQQITKKNAAGVFSTLSGYLIEIKFSLINVQPFCVFAWTFMAESSSFIDVESGTR
jgi:hypothetical protein